MPKATTIADYSERITRVVAYIAAHLDEPIDLERLAGIACFSPFHFHRIYRGVMGEPVAETVRRQRLHRAAVDLLDETRPVASIATQAGYGSVAAFTRAFRAAYGVPPATYRGERVARQQHPPVPFEETGMYQVTIRDTPRLRVAAIAHTGPYQEIGNTFERLFAWGAGRGLMGPSTRSLGVYYDDADVVKEADARADACITIPADFNPDGPARTLDIASGRHAVLTHIGPYADLPAAYRWLFGTWLPASGEEAADLPVVEEYLNNPRDHPPSEWHTEVCLPLLPR